MSKYTAQTPLDAVIDLLGIEIKSDSVGGLYHADYTGHRNKPITTYKAVYKQGGQIHRDSADDEWSKL